MSKSDETKPTPEEIDANQKAEYARVDAQMEKNRSAVEGTDAAPAEKGTFDPANDIRRDESGRRIDTDGNLLNEEGKRIDGDGNVIAA